MHRSSVCWYVNSSMDLLAMVNKVLFIFILIYTTSQSEADFNHTGGITAARKKKPYC